jgi:Zn-dependent protease with chaperone function
LAGAVFAFRGDPKAILRGRVLAVLMLTAYHYAFGFSRTFGEADAYAISLLGKKGISTEPLADLFESLENVHRADPQHGLPRWMSNSMAYMSSHPASAERSARLRKAAKP